jgi:ankyrin repeat protein
LAQEPGLATVDPYAACVAGSHETVEAALAEDPEFALSRGGPEDTWPLIHTCFSGFLRHDPVRAEGLLAVARLLLAHGADPNAIVLRGPSGEPWRLSAIYGAAGRANHAGLTRLLLESGANPNDNESLYHAAEFKDHACLQLLLDHGARIPGSNAVHRKLDFDDLEGLRLLLDRGADPNLRRNGNDEPLLHWAIKNRRGVAFLQLLVDRGADVNATDAHGNTPFQLASRANHQEAIQFLQERGAASSIGDSERQWLFLMLASDKEIAEALRLDPERVHRLLLAHPGALVHLAWDLQREAVARLLDLGFPVDGTDPAGTTALHNACWKGDLRLVRLLLMHHPPLEAVERRFGATPLGWAIHGFQNAKNAEGDYVNPDADYPGVIGALVEAGARVTPEMIKNAPAPLHSLITRG